jgi:hypothetical protein
MKCPTKARYPPENPIFCGKHQHCKMPTKKTTPPQSQPKKTIAPKPTASSKINCAIMGTGEYENELIIIDFCNEQDAEKKLRQYVEDYITSMQDDAHPIDVDIQFNRDQLSIFQAIFQNSVVLQWIDTFFVTEHESGLAVIRQVD